MSRHLEIQRMPIPCIEGSMKRNRSCLYMHCLKLAFGDAIDNTAEAENAPPKAKPLKASSKLALPVLLGRSLTTARVLYNLYLSLAGRRPRQYSRLGSPLSLLGRRANEALCRYGYIDFTRSAGHHTFCWPLSKPTSSTSESRSNQATNTTPFSLSA